MAIGAGMAYAAVGPIRKCVTDLRITVDRTYSEIWGQIRNAFFGSDLLQHMPGASLVQRWYTTSSSSESAVTRVLGTSDSLPQTFLNFSYNVSDLILAPF